MCGIAGAFSVAGGPDYVELVEHIVESQRSRGPDCQAVESIRRPTAHVVLGHDRLNILDLSAAANQPFWDCSGRYGVVFNGEIYNFVELKCELTARGHEFSTRSDTEVLVEACKAWGDNAVCRFRGMFAFALFDRQSERLLLARDRFGVKPLFYHAAHDSVVFASTGALIARHFGLPPDEPCLARWIGGNSCDAEDRSLYAGLKSLRPGSLLSIQSRKGGSVEIEERRYYDLRAAASQRAIELAGKSFKALTDELYGVLAEAVDIRFRADVPVAVSLSGGIDSSSIAALSARGGHGQITGYCFGHPDNLCTEGLVVEEFGKLTGAEVRFVHPPIRDIIESFLPALRAQDAPFRTASILAQNLVYRDVASDGVRVLLGGQGGDEALMGYMRYHIVDVLGRIRRGHYMEAMQSAVRCFPFLWSRGEMINMAKRRLGRRTARASHALIRLSEPTNLQSEWTRANSPEDLQLSDVHGDLLTLLRYEDRNSMDHSIESRLPFMDHRLVEFGVALPLAAKLNRGYGKWILREAMEGTVPDAIRLARFKRGFDVQQSDWIAKGLGAEIRRVLKERQHKFRTWTDRAMNIDDAFSDAEFLRRHTAFSDATVLAWLGERA